MTFRTIRIGCIGTATLLVLGCSGEDGSTSGNMNVGSQHEAVTSGGAASSAPREITVASEPNAKCTLYSPDRTSAKNSMPVWADDVGIVHLWAPTALEAYSLDCGEAGATVKHVLDLADAATFLPAAPRAMPTGRTTLPALTDPMSLSQAELVQAGYPPRPDPELAAPLYKQWLQIVSTPTTLIPSNLVERSDLHFDSYTLQNDLNWGGLVLDVVGRRYVWSLGTLTVPTFSPNGQAYTDNSLWAGVEGTGDLIQDGIDYHSIGVAGTYSAWYQYFPIPNPVFNTSMVVSPGNSMTFWAWEGDAACVNGAGHTGRGCFWYKNNTTGVTAGTFNVVAPNGSFSGKTAPCIMEQQFDNTYLSKFGPDVAAMEFAAVDSNGAWHNFTSDHYKWLTLVNASGQTMLNTVHYGGSFDVWSWVRGN